VRKTLIAILMALALVVIPVGSAFAQDEDTVTVSATPAYVSIDNNPDTDSFGVVTEGSTPNLSGGETNFTITNSSSVAIDITIKCSGWDGGANDWLYGAPGTDQARLMASDGSGGYDIAVPVDPAIAALHSDVPVATNPQWGLQLQAPTDMTFGNVQSTTITLNATYSP